MNGITRHMRLASLALGLMVLSSCGGGGGGGGSSGGGDSAPSTRATGVIGSAGGSIGLDNGALVTVDPGVVNDGSNVAVQTTTAPPSSSPGIRAASPVVRVELPAGALSANGSAANGITVNIPLSSTVLGIAGAATAGAATAGTVYRYVEVKVGSAVLYGRYVARTVSDKAVATAVISAQAIKALALQLGHAYVGLVTLDFVVNAIQPNVPTAGTLFEVTGTGAADFKESLAAPPSVVPAGKLPLVLVHGIGVGCDGNADSYRETWREFIANFYSDSALRQRYQLFTFSYQTDLSVKENGRLLATALKASFGAVPSVVVAHSMGGLVTRSAMVHHAAIGANIGGVITLGTPHHGTKRIQAVAGVIDAGLCVLATDSPGARDLGWDNFDDPGAGLGNPFLVGPDGLNTLDNSNNYRKYVPYAGVIDPASPTCIDASVPGSWSTTAAMCLTSTLVGTSANDGSVPEISARFKDLGGSTYVDKQAWESLQRTYYPTHHISIHDERRVFFENPNGSVGGIHSDLVNFFDSLTTCPPGQIFQDGQCVAVLQATTFIAAGGVSTYAVEADGGLWAWGNGYLGDGLSIDYDRLLPKKIDTSYAAVSTFGASHTVALKQDGSLWTWGSNSWGALGDGGTTTTSLVPRQIGSDFIAVAAGYFFGFAIKSNGSLWAWGFNNNGQLGDGTTTNSSVPKQIGTGYITIAASNGIAIEGGVGYVTGHAVALMENGTLWAWGWNRMGQVGDGTTINRLTPILIGAGYTKIAAGAAHTVALSNDGSLWAWGYNSCGQLGDGSTTNSSIPIKIGTGYTAIAAADVHTVALKDDGSLWAWGCNDDGELGYSGTAGSLTPREIGAGYKAIAAGGGHTVAIKADGTVWTWGRNDHGQLGVGTTISNAVPTRVSIP